MRADSLLSNLFGFINRKGEQYLLPFDTMVDPTTADVVVRTRDDG